MNFKKRISIEQVEEGVELAPKFDDKGVIPMHNDSCRNERSFNVCLHE